jgi:general secretion pathway protein M
MSSSTSPTPTAGTGRLAALRASLQPALQPALAAWGRLALRERRLLTLGASVLGAFLVWAIALAPAWRSLNTTPALRDAAEAQTQQMQALAREATTLRAVAPVPLAQAQQALTTATARLGNAAKLSLQGDRAVLSLKGVGSEQLAAWLGEARAGARARVVEASLNQTSPGRYDGSLTLAVGAGR